MRIEYFIESLARNDEIIRTLVQDLSDEQTHWKPSPEQWSIVEVINHLCDEEREDFRQRMDLILNHPENRWPPNDPEAWPLEREYNKRKLRESMNDFSRERQKSIGWLSKLKSIEWNAAYRHSNLGEIRAGDLLLSWIAHDLLHIRQLTRLHLQYAQHAAESFSSKYAGEW